MKPKKVKIDKLVAQDIHVCAEIYKDVFNQNPWKENWTVESAIKRLEEIYNTPGFLGLKSMSGKTINGFVVGCVESFPNVSHYYLKEMAVSNSMQSKGVGTMLIKQLKQELRQRKIQSLYLLTMKDTFAEYFYVQNGLYSSQLMKVMGCRLDQH